MLTAYTRGRVAAATVEFIEHQLPPIARLGGQALPWIPMAALPLVASAALLVAGLRWARRKAARLSRRIKAAATTTLVTARLLAATPLPSARVYRPMPVI
jgi:uncharacterized membrane protein